MLSKNLNKLRRKPGVVTVAVLSLLLGAQVAALADLQYDFNYGFNRAEDAIGAEGIVNNGQLDVTGVTNYYLGACFGHFNPSSSDVYACDNGGQAAVNKAIARLYSH